MILLDIYRVKPDFFPFSIVTHQHRDHLPLTSSTIYLARELIPVVRRIYERMYRDIMSFKPFMEFDFKFEMPRLEMFPGEVIVLTHSTWPRRRIPSYAYYWDGDYQTLVIPECDEPQDDLIREFRPKRVVMFLQPRSHSIYSLGLDKMVRESGGYLPISSYKALEKVEEVMFLTPRDATSFRNILVRRLRHQRIYVYSRRVMSLADINSIFPRRHVYA